MKIEENNKIVVNYQPSGGKPWAAKIVGKDQKYGLKREFFNPDEKTNMSSSGKTGNAVFYLMDDGYYEVNESWKGRHYLRVENGNIAKIAKEDIIMAVN